MTQAKQTIWLVGPFPPPLHGQAVYNAAFAAHLQKHGQLRVLATGESLVSKLTSYGRILYAVFFQMRRTDVVYTSMPGQMAAWLFALVVAALRLRGMRHFVHHHSYRSIVLGPLRVMRLVVALGGHTQRHILLSSQMRDAFAALYLRSAKSGTALALSNALLFCPEVAVVPPRPPRPVTLGHMSVLTPQKGVDALIRIFRLAATLCPELRLVIAGPIGDQTLEHAIETAIADFPGRVDYRGAISGPAKAQFYADIDLFLLPTRLIDEAEPLVMLESYAAGVEFMANDRGCILERLRQPGCVLTGHDDTDAARVLDVVKHVAADWDALRQACGRHAEELHVTAVGEAHVLFGEMLAVAH
ncbi:MAG: glycosyltransferase family 1 protein [Sphingomonas sp.]|nr:MAG: glycosyltransferase family 1 protein [Sphingomonas sp.]